MGFEVEVEALKVNGIYAYPKPLLSRQNLIEFRKHLDVALVYNSHVSAKATEPPVKLQEAITEKRWGVFAPPMAALIRAPFWFELATSFFELAKEYFDGEFPRLYSLNAFWTKAIEGPLYMDTQAWHRDGDDRKQMTLFMLGSDVPDPSEGAHLYQKGTHKILDSDLGRNFRDAPPMDLVESVIGPAGTVFIVDTGGLHKAIRPATKPRLLVWARFGVSNPPQSYGWDGLSPLPKVEVGDRYPINPELQESIRLVVA